MKKLFFFVILFAQSTLGHAATIAESYQVNKNTLVEGPTSGQFNSNKSTKQILIDTQKIIGLSGVVSPVSENSMLFITDNGFGAKHNSADFLPRIYEFRLKKNKPQLTGHYIQFNDKNRKLNFKIQADYETYYDKPDNPHVDFQIKAERLLTGADIDPEAVAITQNNHIWISDEFGPYLIETDHMGTVLHAPYRLKEIISPDYPGQISRNATTKKSGGFEAMAKTPDEKFLVLMLEQTTLLDKEGDIRLYQFDLLNKKFLDQYRTYHLDPGNMSISDMVAVNHHQFLILEDNAKIPKIQIPNKKVYLIDLNRTLEDGSLEKELICDLQLLFNREINNELHKTKIDTSFVKSSEEVIGIIDKQTLLIANDNNARINTHFIKIKLDKHLNFIEPPEYHNHLKFEVDPAYANHFSLFHDNTLVGWMITVLYFMLSARLIYITMIARKFSTDYIFWLLITLTIIFLSFNKQMDFQTDLTDLFRQVFREQGWYESRREWQKLFVKLSLFATFSSVLTIVYFYRHLWIKYKMILIGFLIIITYILIRLISFHHIDEYFKKVILVFKYHQIFELTGIVVMMIGLYKKTIISQLSSYSKNYNIKNASLIISFDGQAIVCPRCSSRMVKHGEHNKVFKCRKCHLVFTTIIEKA